EKGSPEAISPGFKWFTEKAEYWESIVAYMIMEEGKLMELKIYPVDLGQNRNRANRGRPTLATGDKARKILMDIIRMSEKYGTRIKVKDDVGYIEL
ncbi:MAG: CapA family protein, partial [Candidatus Methanomethylicia archaeon]